MLKLSIIKEILPRVLLFTFIGILLPELAFSIENSEKTKKIAWPFLIKPDFRVTSKEEGGSSLKNTKLAKGFSIDFNENVTFAVRQSKHKVENVKVSMRFTF